MTWREVLEAYRTSNQPLFDDAFMGRWGATHWQPTDDDRAAAAKLHTQLISRVTTQQIGYLEGAEKTALASVYALFGQARDIAETHPQSTHFDALAWHVLNVHIRPFTAKWHGKSERGALAALDATDEFRAELNALQPLMQQFDRLLVYIRDGVEVPLQVPDTARKGGSVTHEMRQTMDWGISPSFGGIDEPAQVAAINAAEREAIQKRRSHYGLTHTSPATGLAMSGGGIRSATFSLGVLVALAQRGLLSQFDYLSTVSGGGYLGAFLSSFLQSPRADVGLRSDQLPFFREAGEAAALRHIRHHCKYLSARSRWERIKMLSAQLLGMVLNGLAVLWLLCLAAVLERWVRMFDIVSIATLVSRLLWVLAAGAVLSLIALRLGGILRRWADAFIALPAAFLAAAMAWAGLDGLHTWYATPSSLPSWSLGDKEVWVAIAGVVPLIAPVLAAVFPRLVNRLGRVVVALSAIAAPVFLLGIYLLLYENSGLLTTPVNFFGVVAPPWLAVAAFGLPVYVFVFDINATSPHRHYRRKLAQAFLIQPKSNSATHFDEELAIRLSELGSHVNKAPYHLINCALNVRASKNIGMQGRLTDFFIFSPAYSGSPLIGYRPTTDWEKLDSYLDLGTAMAISGAATAPQMGLVTASRFSFWLALLNVRLGYWARLPGARHLRLGAPGILNLLKEMLGSMDEKGPWVNLSDGGHIENLGVYELLRRRCKYIVVIDGEEDAEMTFRGLTTLQRLVSIDLGVSIDVDLDDLRLNNAGLSRSHFRFCRVRYPRLPRGTGDEVGYLLYLKLSLTGNEGEFIRRYRLDEPVFPHHPTTDQFFSEAQFEAYRSLGEHVGSKLFLRAIIGDLADVAEVNLEELFFRLGGSLLEPTIGARG